jgi:GGDEF domain-containing protein
MVKMIKQSSSQIFPKLDFAGHGMTQSPLETLSPFVLDLGLRDPLRQLEPGFIEFLRLHGDRRSFIPGQRLWEPKPDPAHSLGLIEQGRASVRLISRPDREVLSIQAGEFFGEHALLRAGSGAFDIVAEEPCDALVLPEPAAWHMMERWPAMAVQLARLHVSRTQKLRQPMQEAITAQFRPFAMSSIDPLTGALNLQRAGEAFRRQIERHSRLGEPSSIGVFRIANLEHIREHIGETAADDALVALMQAIESGCRPGDLKSRSSDVSVSVLFAGVAPQQAAIAVGRVRKAFDEVTVIGSNRLPLPMILKCDVVPVQANESLAESVT